MLRLFLELRVRHGVAALLERLRSVVDPQAERGRPVHPPGFAGEPWTLNGNGEQTRDFIFIDDLVEAIIAAANFSGGGEVFQVATGRATSVRKLAELLARELQQEFGIVPQVRLGPPLPGDMPQNFASIAKARRLLGWAPKWEIEDGIAVTVRWFGERRQQVLGNIG